MHEVKVDVWTGPAGPARPAGLKAPADLPGDSIKQTLALKYRQAWAATNCCWRSCPMAHASGCSR